MNKKLIILSVCALVALPLCAGSNDKNVRGVKLTGKEVKYSISGKDIYTNYQVGNRIIASDRDNLYFTELTDTGLTKEEHFAKIGDAENGFSYAKFAKGPSNSILALNCESGIFVSLKEMVVIPNTKSVANIRNFSTWKRYDLSRLRTFHDWSNFFVSASDSTILIAGTPKEDYRHIFSVIDYKNQKVIPLDYWPEDGVNVPDIVKSSIYTAYSELYSNGKGRFLFNGGRERYSFIFTIDKDKVNVVKELYKVYSDYKAQGQNYVTLSRNSEELRVATNEKNIFLLLVDSDPDERFYGKLPIDDFSFFIYGNTIELYDWDGNKKNILYLDHYGQRIMLSEDGKRLFLFSDDNITRNQKEPHIWAYDINNLDAQPSVDVAEMEKAREFKYKNDMEYRSKTKPETEIVKVDYIKEGDMMADFELYDYDNNPHHLNEFLGKGKYTILEFSSLGCGPCQMAKPTLEKFYKKYKDKFEMITISADRLPEWKKKPLGEVSWHDWNDFKLAREILKKYDVPGFPAFVIIDSDGKVLNECFGLNPFIEALKLYIPAEEVDKLSKEYKQ